MKKVIFWIGAVLAFFLPLVPGIHGVAAGIALVIGLALSTIGIIERPHNNSQLRKLSLNTAVVLFGFGLNISQVITVGSQGFVQTAVSLAVLLVVGFLLLRLFQMNKKTGQLIVFGTAICGGSAIAATAPIIDANEDQIGISTGVIFMLNTVALFLFTFFAQIIPITAEQFGTWAALSIHDTSSVVGAAASYNDVALQIATIMKLTRTLWIIPIVLILSFLGKEKRKMNFPLFIIFFILASLIATFIPFPAFYAILSIVGKLLLSLALYFVGTSLHPQTIRQAGGRSIAFGVSLWMISIVSGFLIAVFL